MLAFVLYTAFSTAPVFFFAVFHAVRRLAGDLPDDAPGSKLQDDRHLP